MIKPMLAYKVGKKEIDFTETVFLQPKLDGVRCVISKDGAFTRQGNQWMNAIHVLDYLKPFFEKHPNIILDGELYNHDLKNDFEKIISLVRKTKPTDLDRLEASALVQFHCYDYISDELYQDRYNFLCTQPWALYSDIDCVKHVKASSIKDMEEALVFHKLNLSNGYEGSILRLNKPYECKRSYNLQKFKDFSDAEATITGYVVGKGKRINTIGKFLAIDSDGNTFGMPIMDKQQKLLANFENMKTWVGKQATFTYFERTKANSYRHPLFKALRDYE